MDDLMILAKMIKSFPADRVETLMGLIERVNDDELRDKEYKDRGAEWFENTASITRKFNTALVNARIDGRWDDVIEHSYHRHYIDCHLRLTGAIPHYNGKEQPDPQVYS